MGCGSSKGDAPGSNDKVPTQQRPIAEVYKFDKKDQLGLGSFACVVRGFHRETNEEVAIKIINRHEMVQQNTLIEDEVNALAEVSDHPNIIKLHAVFVDKVNFYLVMELCKGGDLFSKIVDTGSFSEKDAAMYCQQLAKALQYMHNHGITHRDLKPENLLLDEAGNLKVADFGLSKLTEGDQVAMKTVCGTWAYAAPEVIEGHGYDYLVDIWSLGVLQFVMLAGYHPFDVYGNSTEPKLLKNIVNVNYSYDDPVWESVSDDAKTLIDSLLKSKPKQRMSLDDYLKHKWVAGEEKLNEETKPDVLEKMTAFILAHKAAKKLRLKAREKRLLGEKKRSPIDDDANDVNENKNEDEKENPNPAHSESG